MPDCALSGGNNWRYQGLPRAFVTAPSTSSTRAAVEMTFWDYNSCPILFQAQYPLSLSKTLRARAVRWFEVCNITAKPNWQEWNVTVAPARRPGGTCGHNTQAVRCSMLNFYQSRRCVRMRIKEYSCVARPRCLRRLPIVMRKLCFPAGSRGGANYANILRAG